MDIQNLYEKLKEHSEEMDFKEACPELSINVFETMNGIILPKPYKELLQLFNGGEIFVPGITVYGIHDDESLSLKAVNGKAKRGVFSIPNTFLIIGRFINGDLVCIDLNNSNKIILWDHEKDEEFCYWDSLEQWLEETIQSFEEKDW